MLAAIHGQQQSPGLNPKEALYNLKRLIETRSWEQETDESGSPLTFQRVLEADWPDGVGLTENRRKRLFDLADDAKVSKLEIARVRRAIDNLLPALNENGQHGFDNIKALKGGADPEYIRRRLARDAKKPNGGQAQALYDRLVSGEINANKAMRLWGKPRPYVQVRSDNAVKAIAKLREYYTLAELRIALDEMNHDEN